MQKLWVEPGTGVRDGFEVWGEYVCVWGGQGTIFGGGGLYRF